MKIEKLMIPTFLEEAKMYIQPNTVIIGGGTFLHIAYKNKEIKNAVSLAKLNLDFIKYSEDKIEIGAMTTLHHLETEQKLNEIFNDIFRKVFAHIVGVQFRNLATIGGSVAAKLGYSETIAILLILGAEVEIKGMTKLPIEDYLTSASFKKDLITKIIIPIKNLRISYHAVRNSQTDIPALIIAISSDRQGKIKVAVGARPSVAKIAVKTSDFLSSKEVITSDEIDKAADMLLEELDFGNDIRADKEYRISVTKSLFKNMINEVVR